jgi:hypothetical protein
MIRSMTTAREIIEQARSGTMTGPPLMMMTIEPNTLIALVTRFYLGRKSQDSNSTVMVVVGCVDFFVDSVNRITCCKTE